MSYQDLLTEIKLLPTDEKILLLEAIARFLREETIKTPEMTDWVKGLHGIAKPEGRMPTDEELKEDYISYLEEKYS
jgi:hypothetical protein